MAASFWGGGSIPPPKEVVVTGNSPDLWHTLASPSLCIHNCQTPAGSQGSALPRLRLLDLSLGVWFHCFGNKSLTAVSMLRAILPGSCCVMAPSLPWCSVSPAGFRGLGACWNPQGAAGATVTEQPTQSLSAASKMSVSAVQVCFTVTGIIALNFLCGCYQSVMDTLGKGAL